MAAARFTTGYTFAEGVLKGYTVAPEALSQVEVQLLLARQFRATVYQSSFGVYSTAIETQVAVLKQLTQVAVSRAVTGEPLSSLAEPLRGVADSLETFAVQLRELAKNLPVDG